MLTHLINEFRALFAIAEHGKLAMALIALGSTVSDIRGSIAGTTYSRNKGGAYARARVAPINRRTPAQTQVRANFAANSKAWSGTLTAAERAAWTAFASANPLVNVLGASIIVSGLAMYQKLNQVLAQIGSSPEPEPPPDLTVPGLAAATGTTITAATPVVQVNTDAQAVTANAAYYIFATPPLAAGKTPQTSEYRYIGNFDATAAAVLIDITSDYVALYGGGGAVGNVIGIAVATVNTETGAVTPAVVFYGIVA